MKKTNPIQSLKGIGSKNALLFQKLHIETIEGRIATRACKSAVKGNQKITKEDARKLLEYLLSLENPYQCPHGRPTMIRITQSDLERMFKRIV